MARSLNRRGVLPTASGKMFTFEGLHHGPSDWKGGRETPREPNASLSLPVGTRLNVWLVAADGFSMSSKRGGSQLGRILRSDSPGSPDEQSASPDADGDYDELVTELDRLVEGIRAGEPDRSDP